VVIQIQHSEKGFILKVGIGTCKELHAKLQREAEKLDSDWNEYDFFNFVVTAWHLNYDWLKNDVANRPKFAMKKSSMAPLQMREVIKIARDLANGSKHFTLSAKSAKEQVITEVHPPEIRDWHSWFFSAPKHGVSTKNAYYSVSDFTYLIMEYTNWLFDDSTLDFPDKINKHLKYCKI
jgi:hypothetical protein